MKKQKRPQLRALSPLMELEGAALIFINLQDGETMAKILNRHLNKTEFDYAKKLLAWCISKREDEPQLLITCKHRSQGVKQDLIKSFSSREELEAFREKNKKQIPNQDVLSYHFNGAEYFLLLMEE